MRDYVVYKHTNKINNKIYIGITNDVKRRWRNNGIEYKSSGKNAHFRNAIVKYGWDNFKHEILATGLTKEEAGEKEKQLIAKFNATDKTIGYNVARGGNGGAIYQIHPKGMLGKHQSTEWREEHSAWASNHANNAMTNGQVIWGVTHVHPKGMSGKHQSAKHAEAMKRLSGKNNPRSSTLEISFPDGRVKTVYGFREAHDEIGISVQTINKLIKTGLPFGNGIVSMKNNPNYGLTIKKIPS